jgi:hypothetical protein
LVGGEEAASPKEVGHNIYILCHQLAQHNKELAAMMKPPPMDGVGGDAALQYYANHTAPIEIVRHAGTFQRSVRQICTDTEIVYHVVYLIFFFLGLSTTHSFFFSVLLFDVVYREETQLNAIHSVTRNGRSIVLTAVLAVILVYMFSILGYFSFMSLFHVSY